MGSFEKYFSNRIFKNYFKVWNGIFDKVLNSGQKCKLETFSNMQKHMFWKLWKHPIHDKFILNKHGNI